MTLASITAQDPLAGFCIGKTLPLEGLLSDNPQDPGGVTNRGVSLRWALQEIKADPTSARWLDVDHDGHVDRRDIIGLTADQAATVFFECWWLPGWYGRLAPELVCWKCFDIAINTGPKRSALILQKALQSLGANIPVDAQVGPLTVLAVSAQDKRDGGAALLTAIRKGQAAFYNRLCVLEPQLVTFKKGWLARAAL